MGWGRGWRKGLRRGVRMGLGGLGNLGCGVRVCGLILVG